MIIADCIAAGPFFAAVALNNSVRYCIMQRDELGHYSLGRAITCNSEPRCSRQVGQRNNTAQHGVRLPFLFSYSVDRGALNSQTWDQRETKECVKGYGLFSAEQEWSTAKVKGAE